MAGIWPVYGRAHPTAGVAAYNARQARYLLRWHRRLALCWQLPTQSKSPLGSTTSGSPTMRRAAALLALLAARASTAPVRAESRGPGGAPASNAAVRSPAGATPPGAAPCERVTFL